MKIDLRMRRPFYMFLLLVCSTPFKELMIAGIFFIILGQLMVLLAYGTIKRNNELATSGLYALVRNPVYTGALITSFGYFILSGAGLAPAKFSFLPHVISVGDVYINPAVLFIAIYFFGGLIAHSLRRIKDEEQKLLGIFGDEYTAYQKKVPTRLIPYPPSFFRFRWLLLTYSMETALRNHVFSRMSKYGGLWLVLFIGKEIFLRNSERKDFYLIWKHPFFPIFIGILAALALFFILIKRIQNKFEYYHN
ncbi:MAG: hypothetical protein ABIH42_11540 [Planctomycetota bacterium]